MQLHETGVGNWRLEFAFCQPSIHCVRQHVRNLPCASNCCSSNLLSCKSENETIRVLMIVQVGINKDHQQQQLSLCASDGGNRHSSAWAFHLPAIRGWAHSPRCSETVSLAGPFPFALLPLSLSHHRQCTGKIMAPQSGSQEYKEEKEKKLKKMLTKKQEAGEIIDAAHFLFYSASELPIYHLFAHSHTFLSFFPKIRYKKYLVIQERFASKCSRPREKTPSTLLFACNHEIFGKLMATEEALRRTENMQMDSQHTVWPSQNITYF